MTLDSFLSSLRSFVSAARAAILRRPRVSIVLALVLAALLFAFFPRSGERTALVVIEEKPFLQQVAASGKVKASDDVAMTFERTGRVSAVNVAVGDTVAAGRILATLSSGTLDAELAAARAQVATRKAERKNTAVNLANVKAQEDAKVESAYRALLSTDLIAVANLSSYTAEAPIVTGLYERDAEGDYRVRVQRVDPSSSSHELIMFVPGEDYAPVRISKTGPTALPSLGLYVSFPEEIAEYEETSWTISVPNKKSATYADRYSAYQEALRERERAVAAAEAELASPSGATAIADAQLAAAEAEVGRLLAELAAYRLAAPFDGVVTQVDVGPGDTAGPDTPAVSLISDGELEIESFIPEINISSVSVGDRARITLDAYGEGMPFDAVVMAIDPAETIRDGVSTYRVRLAFSAPDERLLSGMTANIVITTDERPAVLTVPQGAVTRTDGRTYVTVVRDGKEERRAVEVGVLSTLGELEVRSGLSAGETVAVPAP